jgi:hypothetical protein
VTPARNGAAALAALVVGQFLFVLLACALVLAKQFDLATTLPTPTAAAFAQPLGYGPSS